MEELLIIPQTPFLLPGRCHSCDKIDKPLLTCEEKMELKLQKINEPNERHEKKSGTFSNSVRISGFRQCLLRIKTKLETDIVFLYFFCEIVSSSFLPVVITLTWYTPCYIKFPDAFKLNVPFKAHWCQIFILY